MRTEVVVVDGFRALYGLDPDGAVLVRPDGHVSWRGTRADELARALRTSVGHVAA